MKVTVVIEDGLRSEVVTRGSGVGGIGLGAAESPGGGLPGSLAEASGAFDGGPGPGAALAGTREGAAPIPFMLGGTGGGDIAGESSSGDIAAGPAPGAAAPIETAEVSEESLADDGGPSRARGARKRVRKGRARRG